MTRQRNRLKLEDLIDLEVQLRQDQDEDPQRLRERDASIGREIAAKTLPGNALFLAWLDQLRVTEAVPESNTTGHQIKQWLALVGFILLVLGSAMGAGSVIGWLHIDPTEPVNGILFWLVLIGLQVLLLCGWLVAVLPRGWIGRLPLLSGLQMFMQIVGRLIPLAFGWLATRMSGEHRDLLRTVRSAAARFDWLYGRIRFWLLIQLSQVFALAYNMGAVVAFVLLTHGNDPAFCWKSTMLDSGQVAHAAQLAALPWSGLEAATLTRSDIDATRYWSYEQSYIEASSEAGNKHAWRKWSLFLLASLLIYGLLPRVLTLLLASWRVKRAIASVQLDHVGFQRLRERLCRDVVETRSPEMDNNPVDGDGRKQPSAEILVSDGPSSAVKSVGVKLSDNEVVESIRSKFGKTVSSVHSVMGMEDADETIALQAILNGQTPDEVFVVVEAWEPPVREYIDLLANLRSTLGERKMINVLLYNCAADGRAVRPKQRQSEMWQQKLRTIGDPWLRLESLCEEQPA